MENYIVFGNDPVTTTNSAKLINEILNTEGPISVKNALDKLRGSDVLIQTAWGNSNISHGICTELSEEEVIERNLSHLAFKMIDGSKAKNNKLSHLQEFESDDIVVGKSNLTDQPPIEKARIYMS